MRRVDHEPRPSTGIAAVHDDALLRIIPDQSVCEFGTDEI